MSSIKAFFEGRAKDQGDRPTCVAFAVSSLHEYYRDVISAKKGQIELDLSEEFLFYGCKSRDGLRPGADGTTVRAASETLSSDGQCTEALHPYQPGASLLVVPSAAAREDARKRKLNRIKTQVNKIEIVEELTGRGLPIVAVTDIFEGAYIPGADGTVSIPKASERWLGLHAVLIVDVERGIVDPRVVFMNSWGTVWGDNGFGRFTSEFFSKYCRQLWSVQIT